MSTEGAAPTIAAVLAALPDADAVTRQTLRTYHDDLIRFNRTQNLVSRRRVDHRVALLIGEACLAAAAQNINKNEYVLDLGSGAGIPGIPTAIWYLGLRLALLDRRTSRCDFLRREVRALDLDEVGVLQQDAAEPGQWAGRFDRVLLKAVAVPREALRLARPYLRPSGRAVLYREASWDPALEGEGWRLVRRTQLSAAWMERDAAIFEFTAP